MANLNGRLSRLEATMKPAAGPETCRSCGLRHASAPVTLRLLRGILRVVGGSDTEPPPRTPLCLCDPCCGDPRDRWVARRSHGLDDEPDAA